MADTGTCYLLYEDGSRIILEDGSGFLLVENCIVTDGDYTGHGGYEYDWKVRFTNERYEEEQRKKKEKQDEIIRLRLEAQEALLEQRGMKQETSKQAKRQLRALEKQYLNLQQQILKEMQALEEMQRQEMIWRKMLALLLLQEACPFSSISMTLH